MSPYEYFDSCAKMDEKKIPPKEAFYSKDTDTYISEEDSQHALNVIESFKCGTMRRYHKLYLLTMYSAVFLIFFVIIIIFIFASNPFDVIYISLLLRL